MYGLITRDIIAFTILALNNNNDNDNKETEIQLVRANEPLLGA